MMDLHRQVTFAQIDKAIVYSLVILSRLRFIKLLNHCQFYNLNFHGLLYINSKYIPNFIINYKKA